MNKYRRTSDRLVKKKWGGLIGTALGAGAGAFVGNPMVGASVGGAIGGGIDSMRNKPNKITQPKTTGTGHMGYKYGGNIKRSLPKYPKGGQMRKIGPNAASYSGPSHEAGGIPIDAQGNPNKSNPVAEIEGGETRQDDFIFSDELMVPGTEMSFAEAHEMLLQEGAEEADIEELAMMQEQVKQEQGIENDGGQAPQQQMAMEGQEELPMMQDGGDIGERLKQRPNNISDLTNQSSVRPTIESTNKRYHITPNYQTRNRFRANGVRFEQAGRNTPFTYDQRRRIGSNAVRGTIGARTMPNNLDKPFVEPSRQRGFMSRAARGARNIFSPLRGNSGSSKLKTGAKFLGKATGALGAAALITDGLEYALSPEQESVIQSWAEQNPELLERFEQGDEDAISQVEQKVEEVETTMPAQGSVDPNRIQPSLRTLGQPAPETGMINEINSGTRQQEADAQEAMEPTSQENVTNEVAGQNTQFNTDVSVVDLMNSLGMDSSFENRAVLANRLGITNYKGTAEQNETLRQLLNEEYEFESKSNNPIRRSRDNSEQEALQNSLNQGVPGQPRYMKYGGRLKKKVDKYEAGGLMQTAQRYAPSVIDAGMALFSKKPKKVTPNTITPTTIDKDRSNYNDTKSNIGRSARTAISGGGNAQAAHATTLRGLSSAASSQNQYESGVDAQNAGIINNAQSQNAQMKYQADVRNNENQMRDKASRINLMRNAVTRPLDMAVADKRNNQQTYMNMATAFAQMDQSNIQIFKPMLKEMGLSDEQINQLMGKSEQEIMQTLQNIPQLPTSNNQTLRNLPRSDIQFGGGNRTTI